MGIGVMKMTLRDLAKLANVSVSTVSKAFCDADDISDETKKLIFSLAKENGCYGKYYKGKYHKKIIALIVPELTSKHYVAYVDCMRELIEADGGICVISSFDFNSAKQAELIDYYASYLKADGIIVFSLSKPLKKGYDVPIVALASSVDTKVDTVNINIGNSITEAVKALDARGHKKIAFISERLTWQREELYKKAMLEIRNTNIISVVSRERFEKAGVEGIEALFKQRSDITAVICAYDYIAFGAIKQLKKMGLKVPDDVSVVGIDNISTSEFAETSLSTIDSNPREVSHIVYDLLAKKLKNPFYRVKQNITINSQFIIRESIGNAKK